MHGWKLLKGVAAVMVFSTVLTGTALEAASQELADGEDQTIQERIFTLGEIEVVGKEEESRNKTIEKVYDEEMRLFDANTVAEAANLLPGVTISKLGARSETMLYVRGFDLKHVPLFLDGIPIYVPYDGYPDLGRFTTFDLSEIVVSKGFTSVLYGPNTMGGAINMVSKRPVKAFEGNIGGGYGSGSTYNTYGNFGTNQGKWYLQGGASYIERDHYRVSEHFSPTATEDGGVRENSYFSDAKGNVKLGLTPNETDEYALSYINQHGRKGVPPYAGESPSVTTRYWKWPYWDKESFYFNSNTALGSDSYVKSRLYYDMFENSLRSYDDATYSTMNKRSSFKSWYDDHTAGGSVEMGTALLPRNAIKAAFHYKRDIHKEHNAGYPIQRFEDEMWSVGVEDTIDITEKLYTIIGASYDRMNTLQAEDLNSTTRTTFDFETDDTYAFNPQIGLFYKVFEDGVAHASIAAKSRIPSIKDKYSYRMGTALPNPGLDPEESINYEIGYQQTLFKKFLVETTLFYYDIDDFILSRTIPDPGNPGKTLTQNQNIGNIEQYGVELGVSGQILSNLKGGANYTYLYYNNKSNDDELTNTPEHKVFAYLQYFPIQRLSLLGNIEYNSKRFSESNGSRWADGYFLLNAKVGYEILEGLIAEVGIDNALDEDYELDEGFPEQGRSLFANVRYRF
jgi:iron complex outermembrane receptor protein